MKKFSLFLVLSALLLAFAPQALAAYPEKPISVICPFGAGTGADLIIRPVLPFLKEALKTDLVMDYKQGAAGIVGANFFMTKKPDGYSMLFYNQPHILLQEMFMETAYKNEDLVPVLGLTYRPDFVIVRANDDRFKTIDDILSYTKANPGKVTLGTVGTYSGNHLTYALLVNSTGLEFTRVPFENGGKMVAALLGGQVDMILSSYMWIGTYEGQLNALASCTTERLVPTVPTLEESGVKGVYDTANSNFLFLNKNTKPEIIDYVKKALAPLVDSEGVKKAMFDANMEFDYAVYNSEQCIEMIEQYKQQIEKVRPLLKD